jgi:hypothetical protein
MNSSRQPSRCADLPYSHAQMISPATKPSGLLQCNACRPCICDTREPLDGLILRSILAFAWLNLSLGASCFPDERHALQPRICIISPLSTYDTYLPEFSVFRLTFLEEHGLETGTRQVLFVARYSWYCRYCGKEKPCPFLQVPSSALVMYSLETKAQIRYFRKK